VARRASASEPGASPRVTESRDGDEIIAISVGTDLIAALNEHRVLVTRRSGGSPFTVSVPHESEADALAAELRNLGHDACLRDTLTALLDRFSA